MTENEPKRVPYILYRPKNDSKQKISYKSIMCSVSLKGPKDRKWPLERSYTSYKLVLVEK